jgi:ribose 1,5-bisphosphokinase
MSKLFYVIGASGAGKDTLMNFARTRLSGSDKVIFAHRYITRLPFTGNENHVYLPEQEFKLRISEGLFSLHWESHGQYYGIGAEINMWMEKGFNVVVNGSRQYLPVAQKLYPQMVVILIDASPEIISERLSGRGRESVDEIKKRISRSSEISADFSNCIKIQNDSEIEEAGNALLKIITLAQKLYV